MSKQEMHLTTCGGGGYCLMCVVDTFSLTHDGVVVVAMVVVDVLLLLLVGGGGGYCSTHGIWEVVVVSLL